MTTSTIICWSDPPGCPVERKLHVQFDGNQVAICGDGLPFPVFVREGYGVEIVGGIREINRVHHGVSVAREATNAKLEEAARLAETLHARTGVIDGGECGRQIAEGIRELKVYP